jgi:hypothetical protein
VGTILGQALIISRPNSELPRPPSPRKQRVNTNKKERKLKSKEEKKISYGHTNERT